MGLFAPPIRAVRTLQYWWLGFTGLLLAGGLVVFGHSYGQAGSVREALTHYPHFQHQVVHQLLVFLLLLVVSTTARKAVWWLAIGIITIKAVFLVAYYVTTNIAIQSSEYYGEFMYCCTVLHLRYVPGMFFSEPFSLALLGLYAYWVVVCWSIVQTKA